MERTNGSVGTGSAGRETPGYFATQPIGPIGSSARAQPFDFAVVFWAAPAIEPADDQARQTNHAARIRSQTVKSPEPCTRRSSAKPALLCLLAQSGRLENSTRDLPPATDASFACTQCPQRRKSSGPRVGDEAPDQRRILDAACALHTR